MIRLAENVATDVFCTVPLSPAYKSIYVEVASNKNIDLAIVDDEQLKKFGKSDSDEIEGVEWVENTRNYEFEFEFPDNRKRHLLLWNCNEPGDATIAYKVTPFVF